jgi:DNA-3-methyladenine glycosylase
MRRGAACRDARLLCAGPGRVGQALGITLAHYGLPLDQRAVSALLAPADGSAHAHRCVAGPRIGISKAQQLPWRFGWADSPYLSRRF